MLNKYLKVLLSSALLLTVGTSFSENVNAQVAVSTSGVDQITDFSSSTDSIRLTKARFTALDNTSNINGALIDSDFAVVTSDSLAQGSSAEIVYNSSNGNLFYNQNNDAVGFGTGGLFATIAGSPLLAASNFVVFL